MVDHFHSRIAKSLADPNLQAALDANAERRVRVRQQAFAALPDHAERRLRGHAVRAEVIAHLDAYLDQFIQRAQANGMIVHRAANAVEAVTIVQQIASQHQARTIAKSKTMVSEEIRLNHVLEATGLRVVETDLGEYIVQLRGEAPSHIITPAVHLRRGEVGQTFHEKLGVPLTDDIPTMTEVARRTLREVFLTAEIGLSGVNFGVVESGTLCVITNEGNGRMVTTVPPVHIALMGIERLVPSLDDLALMLSLLPRSATGQQMTVYASLINGPRRPDDPDGAQERHLVLVDNGRAALRGGALEEALYCIRCGACLNACPVFREIGGHAYVGREGQGSTYPGPIGSVLSPALFGQLEFGHLARASSLCGACKEACPVDIDLPRLLLRVRAGGVDLAQEKPPSNAPRYLSLGLSLFRWAAVSPRRFHLAQRAAGFFSRFLAPFSPWLRLPAVTGWGYSKDFPRPAPRPFHERFAELRAEYAADGDEPEGAAQPVPGTDRSHADLLGSSQTAAQAPLEGETLAARFTRELVALGGQAVHCTTETLAQAVLAELQQRGLQEILAWDAAYLPTGLAEALKENGVRLLDSPSADCRAGLTGTLAAAAETATLALPGGPGRMLSASLLPEVHLAVVQTEQILLGLADVLVLPEIRREAASALVSGPSRTADIEMTLTIGVHGPKEVIVFILDGVG
jgi:L-lactate dehydrogenase complex protein LldF